jgi:hypothetical protein
MMIAGGKDYDKAVEYIEARFKAQNDNVRKPIYVHCTCATDTCTPIPSPELTHDHSSSLPASYRRSQHRGCLRRGEGHHPPWRRHGWAIWYLNTIIDGKRNDEGTERGERERTLTTNPSSVLFHRRDGNLHRRGTNAQTWVGVCLL